MWMKAVSGLPAFALFFSTALALTALYLTVYTLVTAHNEFTLIKRNVTAAATALGLSLVGFALPLASAVTFSTNIVELIVWGLVALVVQIAIYFIVRLLIPNLSERIAADEMSAALFLGAASLAAGVVNAASMTY